MNENAITIKNKQALRSLSLYMTPSISQALFVIILIVLALKGNSLLNDLDIGWHVRVGENIIDTLTIPRSDIYSFITPTRSWLAHEWLSEVIMGAIHKFYGLTGLVIFFSLLIAVIYSAFFSMLQAREHNLILNVLITLITIAASMMHWLARPHIFSLGLTLAFYCILREFYREGKNYIFVLPILTVLWVNLHGGFIIGPILVFIYLGAIVVDAYTSNATRKKSSIRRAKQISLVALFCLLATLVNPYGYDLLLYPFQVVAGKLYTDNNIEFLSPDFHTRSLMPFEIFIIMTVLIPALSRRGLKFIEVCLIVFFAHMALVSVRYIPLFGIIIAPILAEHSAAILEVKNNRFVNYIRKKADEFEDIDGSAKGHLLIAGTIIAILLATVNGSLSFSFSKEKAPVDAMEFLKKEHMPGKMFNQEIFGEYTIYAARDQYKIFIDDRFDMYGDEQFKDYITVVRIGQDWQNVFDKYDINWIFFSNDTALSRALSISKDWRLIYSDKLANIFVRNIPANQYLISKYGDVRPAIREKKEKDFLR